MDIAALEVQIDQWAWFVRDEALQLAWKKTPPDQIAGLAIVGARARLKKWCDERMDDLLLTPPSHD